MSKTFSYRFDESLIAKIKNIADSESRSTNKQIEYILKKYIDSLKESK